MNCIIHIYIILILSLSLRHLGMVIIIYDDVSYLEDNSV